MISPKLMGARIQVQPLQLHPPHSSSIVCQMVTIYEAYIGAIYFYKLLLSIEFFSLFGLKPPQTLA